VFGREGTFKKRFLNVGTPTALCITPRRRQVLYVAHSGHPDGMEDAAIYKIDLEGKIVGKFGRASKQLKEFGLVTRSIAGARTSCSSASWRTGELAGSEAHAEGRAVRRWGRWGE